MKKLLPILVSCALGTSAVSAWAENLTNIYDQAKLSDPTLLSAEAQKDAAFEQIQASHGVLLPQINLTAGYTLTRSDLNSANSDRASMGLGLTQSLYNRTSWLNLDSAEKSARRADAIYAGQQQSLILRTAQAYFEVLRAKDNLEFVKAEKATVARQLEQTKQRFDVGLSAITDVHDAQAQFDSVLAQEILAENELTNSYESIREITGKEYQSLSTLDTKRFSASRPAQPLNELLNTAGEKNLSLLSMRIAQDIARDQVRLASAGKLPTLNLSANYNMLNEFNSDNNYYGVYDPLDNVSVGLNFSMPLYTGGTIDANTRKAEYSLSDAGQQLEASYRSVVKNVRAYYNNISASIGTIRAYQQSVVSAKSALDATEAGFDVGTRTIVDVLDSTRRLYDANRSLANARYDYILSVLQLKQAVGTLSEQDIVDISAGLSN